jgi:hypothetical protein
MDLLFTEQDQVTNLTIQFFSKECAMGTKFSGMCVAMQQEVWMIGHTSRPAAFGQS